MGGRATKTASPSSSSTGSQTDQQQATSSAIPNSKPKKKICCACPDTKRLRDECIVEHGGDSCSKLIEAHLICLRAEGFKEPRLEVNLLRMRQSSNPDGERSILEYQPVGPTTFAH